MEPNYFLFDFITYFLTDIKLTYMHIGYTSMQHTNVSANKECIGKYTCASNGFFNENLLWCKLKSWQVSESYIQIFEHWQKIAPGAILSPEWALKFSFISKYSYTITDIAPIMETL